MSHDRSTIPTLIDEGAETSTTLSEGINAADAAPGGLHRRGSGTALPVYPFAHYRARGHHP